MVTTLKVAKYETNPERSYHRVSHNLALMPLGAESLEFEGILSQQIVDYLNIHSGWNFSAEDSTIICNGKPAIKIQNNPPFRLSLHVASEHAVLNAHIEHFLKTHYPIKRRAYREVS